MTIGIGLDVVHLPEFEARLADSFFVDACFTDRERAYCDSQPGEERRAHSYGGRFAAKEAFIKAFTMAQGTSLTEAPALDLGEIEVIGSVDSAPRLKPNAAVSHWLKQNSLGAPLLTISHDGPVAAAVVILTRAR